MVSRANKEERKATSYGAPMSTPAPNPERDRERQEKLERKAEADERARLIEEHEARGRKETARATEDRRTEAPKPKPYERVGETTGKSPAQIIAERPADVMEAVDRAEGVKPTREPEPAKTEPTTPRRPLREPPKQKRR
jgi:hypothetical protein